MSNPAAGEGAAAVPVANFTDRTTPQDGFSHNKAAPSGRSRRFNSDPHPSAVPTSHRDQRMSAVVDRFEAQQSIVERMKEKDVPDPRVRGKGKPVASDRHAQLSPSSTRDGRMAAEGGKFEQHDGIAQLVGERDRQTAARSTGKTKNVTRDTHPDVVQMASAGTGRQSHFAQESERAANSPGGAMSRLGADDHANLSRRRVMTGAGSRKTTSELLAPPAGERVIVKRRGHATESIRHTFEEAITARTGARREAQDACSQAYDFLSRFSDSTVPNFQPSLRQVDHRKATGADLISGRAAMDRPSSTELAAASRRFAQRQQALAGHAKAQDRDEALREPSHAKAERYDRTLNSSHVTNVLQHPDHRPFSTRMPHRSIVRFQRVSARDSGEGPDWWARPRDGRPVSAAQSHQTTASATPAVPSSSASSVVGGGAQE